jgi:hypothetical protein
MSSDRGNDKRGKKKEKKRYYKKKGYDAHVCREWDSDESSTDSSSDEDAANIAVNKGLLFPNVGHKCFMAKDGKKKKVQTRTTPKYTTSSDDGSSSEDEDDLLTLFANLNMQQKEKLNELIGVIHEKDELLDSQEEFLIKENKKHVKVKNAYAQEVEKCENLIKELSMCHDSITNLRTENASLISKVKDLNVCNETISCLRDENVILHAKIDELNVCKPSTSTVDHVTICTRCRDVNINVVNDHLALIKQENDHIAQLTAKINEHEIENGKFKFARNMLYSGRRPGIEDGIGFQQESNVKHHPPIKHPRQLKMRNRLKMMKIRRMSHLKRRTMIKGEMKTRKMIEKYRVKDCHTQESTKQFKEITCHTRFQGQSRAHSICVPGSISTHTLMSQV